METLIISSIGSALGSLGDLIRPGQHAFVMNGAHVPGQSPSKTVIKTDARTIISSVAQDDFPGTQIEVFDVQLIDVLPSTDRPTGSYYLVDGQTYKAVKSKKYIAGSSVVMFQHLARPTAAEGFVW